MSKIPYNAANPDMRFLRLAVFERLRQDSNWKHLPGDASDFEPYIEFQQRDLPMLLFHLREVMWQLFCEGVLAPGTNSSNLELPWFHLTDLGRSVVNSQGPNPFDPEGYVDFVKRRVSNPDSTVIAYLLESLNTQRHGNLAASAVMLGIAAERVFLLVCQSLLAAITDTKDKTKFEKILARFPMKPKVEWVRTKMDTLQNTLPTGFPDNSSLMVVGMYDLIRNQRNDLGHPREQPPNLERDDVLGNLQVFIRYYETAENLRGFLASNQV